MKNSLTLGRAASQKQTCQRWRPFSHSRRTRPRRRRRHPGARPTPSLSRPTARANRRQSRETPNTHKRASYHGVPERDDAALIAEPDEQAVRVPHAAADRCEHSAHDYATTLRRHTRAAALHEPTSQEINGANRVEIQILAAAINVSGEKKNAIYHRQPIIGATPICCAQQAGWPKMTTRRRG